MARRLQKKRRRQNKTDYKLRVGLLKSELPRIVIRKTNKYLNVQLVESDEAQDKIICGGCSKDLLEYGWDKKFEGSLKSIPAAYLTGLLIAKKIKSDKKVILDIGMNRNISGSRIYGVVKGLVDEGVDIKVDEKVFPSEERLNGEHLKPEIKLMINKVREKLK